MANASSPDDALLGLPAGDWVGHLSELRWRLVLSVAAVAVATVIGWFLVPALLESFRQAAGVERLVFTAPAEAFLTTFRLSIVIGMVLASPIVIFQAWRFVLPALFPHEKRVLRRYVPLALCLATLGLAFGYWVAWPVTLRVVLGLGSKSELWVPAVSIRRMTNFFLSTTLPFAAIFQTPVVLFVLIGWGAVSVRRLRQFRRAAYLLFFILGGVLTPPGVVLQLLMAVPLCLLFEISLWLADLLRLRPDADVDKADSPWSPGLL